MAEDEKLLTILQASAALVSDGFYTRNFQLFETEHLHNLSLRLLKYFKEKSFNDERFPKCQDECTPSLYDSFKFFDNCIYEFYNESVEKNLPGCFAEALESSGIRNILILMGQRLTPGSITDEQAIPPLKKTLIQSVTIPYNVTLTVAAREWTKHTNRSHDLFWGKIEGSDEYKNAIALEFIEKILTDASWWNVFYHFKHQIVFEARLQSGHGARWAKDGKEFIGFLEPFVEES